ncbi:MAG: hypothetical protein RLZZ292_2733 [Bacteroidota bacterium]|jgi:hypothetical protein
MPEFTNKEYYDGLLLGKEAVMIAFYQKFETQVKKLCVVNKIPQPDDEVIFMESFKFFIYLLRETTRYEFKGHHPLSYAYKIAYYKVKEYWHDKGQREWKVIETDLDNDDKLEKEKLFDQAFGQLGVTCMTLLTLYFYMDKTNEEIAEYYRMDKTEEYLFAFYQENKMFDEVNAYQAKKEAQQKQQKELPKYTVFNSVNRKKKECERTFKELLIKNNYFEHE